jgi:NADPH2:quinone reductase
MENLQLKSVVTPEGNLELFLESSTVPECSEDEVIIEVQAAPINPSDVLMMFGAADMSTAQAVGTPDDPRIRAKIPEAMQKATAAKVGKALPWGIEGAGVVIATGRSAKALMGKTVAVIGGAMYARYRVIAAKDCLRLIEGTTPREGASCFVNPQTVLGMVETMRMEGHCALVHTAAASNLGQMLQKLCINEGVELVNIVRKQEHVDLLKGLGAQHVCNSSAPDFFANLTDALDETKATIAFDAIGGGGLAGQILTAMNATRHGSSSQKQLYYYGSLDSSPAILNHSSFGASWGLGRYGLGSFQQKIGADAAERLKQKIVSEITTTFASNYTKEVSLQEALTMEAISVYHKCATGEKYLINPSR